MTLQIHRNDRYEYIQALNIFLTRRPKHTQKAYKQRIKYFLKWCSLNEYNDITQVNHNILEEYIAYMLATGKKPNSINANISPIKSFFNILEKTKLIKNNTLCLVRSCKIDRRQCKTQCPDSSVINKLLNSIPDNSQTNHRDKLIILFFLNTGMRREELKKLKVKDIKLDHVLIEGKGQRKRSISISKKLKKQASIYIAYYKLGIEEELFQSISNNNRNKPLTSDSIGRIIKKRAKDINEYLTPHMFRVYFATNHFNIDTPISVIQRIMGHESINQTQRYIAISLDNKISSKHCLEIGV
ncbi:MULTISPECIES: tyrosine-type recombinase/integrase [unclassified Halobacteriovorax]|uniref:tyrosine-type recombinase/integrase n=1 Tax=unclassified Halobacteriovorax TaxID=2639665 RepID=UPI00399BC632